MLKRNFYRMLFPVLLFALLLVGANTVFAPHAHAASRIANDDVTCTNADGSSVVLTQDQIDQGTVDLTNAGLSSDQIAAYQSDPCSLLNDTPAITDEGTLIAGPPQGDFQPLQDSNGNTIGYCGHANIDYDVQSHLFLNADLAGIHLSQYVCSQGNDLTDGSGGKPSEPDMSITPSLLGGFYGITATTQSHLEIGSNGSAKGLWVIDLKVSVSPINPFSGKTARTFDQFFYLDISKIPNCLQGC